MKNLLSSNLLLFALANLTMANCSHSKASPPATGSIAVAIQPDSVTMPPGLMVPFSGTVNGSRNMALDWSVAEGPSGGTVTAQGLYTAPTATGIYHVVATSRTDATKSATAAVTVTTVI